MKVSNIESWCHTTGSEDTVFGWSAAVVPVWAGAGGKPIMKTHAASGNACLLACLLSCLLACLPACLCACLLACMDVEKHHACLVDFWLAGWLAGCLVSWLVGWLLDGCQVMLHACLLANMMLGVLLVGWLYSWPKHWLLACLFVCLFVSCSLLGGWVGGCQVLLPAEDCSIHNQDSQ
jgi:hypothetical protein